MICNWIVETENALLHLLWLKSCNWFYGLVVKCLLFSCRILGFQFFVQLRLSEWTSPGCYANMWVKMWGLLPNYKLQSIVRIRKQVGSVCNALSCQSPGPRFKFSFCLGNKEQFLYYITSYCYVGFLSISMIRHMLVQKWHRNLWFRYVGLLWMNSAK